jgi:repressor LexA
VVARLHDEVTVKRIRQRRHLIELAPENSDFEPIVIDTRREPLTIEGLVVGIFRNGKP